MDGERLSGGPRRDPGDIARRDTTLLAEHRRQWWEGRVEGCFWTSLREPWGRQHGRAEAWMANTWPAEGLALPDSSSLRPFRTDSRGPHNCLPTELVNHAKLVQQAHWVKAMIILWYVNFCLPIMLDGVYVRKGKSFVKIKPVNFLARRGEGFTSPTPNRGVWTVGCWRRDTPFFVFLRVQYGQLHPSEWPCFQEYMGSTNLTQVSHEK